MASSSSSASSSTANDGTTNVSQQQRQKTFNDLLVRAGRNVSYNDWLISLEDTEAKTRELRYQKRVLGAQVNAWQFCVFHKKRTSAMPSSTRVSLPSDVVSTISFLLGKRQSGLQRQASSSPAREDL
ncbi:unnamed protein product [Amoebophrya sp. A120]|nr:unnamed protein product [Amoebophrya sp. A120]|eukprot:GSA120T00003526001.1